MHKFAVFILKFSMTKLKKKIPEIPKAIQLFAGFLLFTYRLFQIRLCLEGKDPLVYFKSLE